MTDDRSSTQGAARKDDRIGVILVHGIGEQTRFEHLEGHARPLLKALKAQAAEAGSKLTIEILESPGGSLYADQASWASGPTIRATLVTTQGVRRVIEFHEVWWADSNEKYDLFKQLRFWLWGWSVWFYPRADERHEYADDAAMSLPWQPKELATRIANRIKLYLICNIFFIGALSIGLFLVVLERLLELRPPPLIRLFVNYLGAVKLYNQQTRHGGAPLDAIGDPPRVSIRRRMVKTLVDVATQSEPYDDWYVVAHSLGSVVAHNGLMASGTTLVNYLDRDRWDRLLSKKMAGQKIAGPGRPGQDWITLDPAAELRPRRAAWANIDSCVYRDRLFARFRGLYTYGSPLDKYAAIWPRRAQINVAEPAFRADAEWINVYDGTDPVGAALDAFVSPLPAGTDPLKIIEPVNYAYKAFPILLLSHNRYLEPKKERGGSFAEAMISAIVERRAFEKPSTPSWLVPHSGQDRWRTLLQVVQWIIVAVIVVAVGAWAAVWLLPPELTWANFGYAAAILVLGSGAITLLAGICAFFAHKWRYRRIKHARAEEAAGHYVSL